MLAFFLAAVLPGMYWDQGPATSSAVKQAGIERVCVPAGEVSAWKAAGVEAPAFDAARFVKLRAPGVQYRMDVASATHIPWIDANGWRFERDGGRAYYCDAPRGKATLAAAEAFAYGADAVVHPDPEDLTAFGRMHAFLRTLDGRALSARANIGIIDDGSAEAGEVMNLMARRNLLFHVIAAPEAKYDLNVRIGTAEYPKAEAANPARFAALVREKLGDEKRLVRLYGSDVVLVRLSGDDAQARVQLINYSGRKVEGLRVRLRGTYEHGALAAFGVENAALVDYGVADGGTEFTIPEMGVYAVVELKK